MSIPQSGNSLIPASPTLATTTSSTSSSSASSTSPTAQQPPDSRVVQQPAGQAPVRARALPTPIVGGGSRLPDGDHATREQLLTSLPQSPLPQDLNQLLTGYASARDHDAKGASSHHWRDRSVSHPVIEQIAQRFHWGSDLRVTLEGKTSATMISLDHEVLEVETTNGALDNRTGITTTGANFKTGLQRYRLNLDDLLPEGFKLTLMPLDTAPAARAAAWLADKPIPSQGMTASQLDSLTPDSAITMAWTHPTSAHRFTLERFTRAGPQSDTCTVELRAPGVMSLPVTPSSTRSGSDQPGVVYVFHVAEQDLPSLGLQAG